MGCFEVPFQRMPMSESVVTQRTFMREDERHLITIDTMPERELKKKQKENINKVYTRL